MVYPAHYLLNFGGTICQGKEIWSNNIRFASMLPLGEIPPDYEDVLTELAAKLRTHAANGGSKWNTDTKCTYLKFNKIDPDGHYASDTESNTLFLSGTDVISGGGTSYYVPPQIAVCISFTSDIDRGPASKGRIFQPRPGIDVSASGIIDAPDTLAMANAWKTLIEAWGNWTGPDMSDVAPALVSNVGDGVKKHIRGVNVGSVWDTQRRRRNALLEVRSAVAVANPI